MRTRRRRYKEAPPAAAPEPVRASVSPIPTPSAAPAKPVKIGPITRAPAPPEVKKPKIGPITAPAPRAKVEPTAAIGAVPENVETAPISIPRAETEKTSRTAANILTAGLIGVGVYLLLRTQQTYQATKAGEQQYMSLVIDAAHQAGIAPALLAGIVTAESGWDNRPNARSSVAAEGTPTGAKQPHSPENQYAAGESPCILSTAGALGLGQILYTTAKGPGVGYTGPRLGLCDPATNLAYSARYLAALQNKYGNNWTAIAQAYNAGPGNYDKGNIGTKTVDYASKVVANAQTYQQKGLAGLTLQPVAVFNSRSRALRTA